MAQIAIYGSGGFARELAWLVSDCQSQGHRVIGFIDDDDARVGQTLDSLPIWSLQELARRRPDTRVVLAIGSPGVRATLAAKVTQSGLEFVSLIHPSVLRSSSVDIGPAAVICAGTILTVGIALGAHVQINLGCTVGHDVVMEDFATLAPGVHVSGNVVIRKGAYIGTGAVIINGTAAQKLDIGAGAVVGAGACVTCNVPAEVTVGGVPAKPLRSSSA